jgi:cytochrome c553
MRRHFTLTAIVFFLALATLGLREARAQSRTFTKMDQQVLNTSTAAGTGFGDAFEHGDMLFSNPFNEIDGSGAKAGTVFNGTGMIRYTRVPRANLTGTGEWANHFPSRATGPNAVNCSACHNKPTDDAAGDVATNAVRDPNHSGNEFNYIQRNTPHLFAAGALQRLAEEMTQDLKNQRQTAITNACALAIGSASTVSLSTKGTSYGSIKATHSSGTGSGCVTSVSTSGVVGVDADLIVKPYQWKGNVAFLRDFMRGAAHNEIGMEPKEMAGVGKDGDGDGVVDELGIGDLTAFTVYMAAQPRPTTLTELNNLGLLETPLTQAQKDQISRGSSAFASIGCASCHHTNKTLNSSIFSEPSASADYRDKTFPSGDNPLTFFLDPAKAIKFDLTKDQPDNQITDAAGNVTFRLGSLIKNSSGKAQVDLFSDLKRHDLGSDTKEPIDEAGTGASVWLTKPLWGVGTTSPYMHDGSAPSLQKAIAMHGGEAATARSNFNAAASGTKDDLIAFMNNLVLFKLPEAN